jgi:hypothetical protein
MDLCLDSILVLNQIPKQGLKKPFYNLFAESQKDYMQDFQVEWGEPVVVKKHKGAVSDLKVTGHGEWS